jgi:peptide-N4-(N-acetyl-beta-glucosaminyl)asparagine amidase
MRLPGTCTFQEIYQINLNQPLNCGDCGSFILDAKLQVFYGYVVAISENKRIAFLLPISRNLPVQECMGEAS